MKTIKAIAIIGMVLMIVSRSSATVLPSHSISDIIARMEENGWTVGSERQVDLVEGQVSRWWYRSFQQGLTYEIVAYSDDADVNDVDLEVEYSDGTHYVADKRSSAFASVIFTPPYYETLRIRVKNCNTDTPDYASTIKFIVFYK